MAELFLQREINYIQEDIKVVVTSYSKTIKGVIFFSAKFGKSPSFKTAHIDSEELQQTLEAVCRSMDVGIVW